MSTVCQTSVHSTLTPWAWCNLDRNPFGEWSREDRATLAVVDWEAAWAHSDGSFGELDQSFPRGHLAWQWIAPCGFGKTTRLLAAGNRFIDAHYVYVSQEKTCDPIPEASVLMIDEADRLPRRIFHAVTRTGTALMLGTHRCLRKTLRRCGYRVVTRTIESENDAERLVSVVRRRMEACRLSRDQPLPSLTRAQAQRWIDRHGRDFRAIEHAMYLCVQQQRFADGELSLND